MQKTFIKMLPLFLFCQASYAMFCPNGFNQVQIGDSIETVIQQCGKPDEEITNKEKPAETGPQEWSYYVQQTPNNPVPIKLTIAFNQGKVITLNVNGAGGNTTDLCGGHLIKTDDTMEAVKAACGSPTFVNKGEEVAGKEPQPAIEITEYRYKSTPPATLIFKNKKLDSRVMK